MMGLTRGTRHYIQYKLAEGDTWQDLVFENPESQEISGLWASRSYSRARQHLEALAADTDNPLENYRIVRRTWDEQVIEHKESNAIADDDEVDSDADQSVEDAEHEPVNEGLVDEPTNPLIK